MNARIVKRRARQARPPVPKDLPTVAAELEDARVIERPDGYWVLPSCGGRKRGPYKNLIEAIESTGGGLAADEDELQSGDTLAEVEAQLGVADWIDPETSEPAEDNVPHIEEH